MRYTDVSHLNLPNENRTQNDDIVVDNKICARKSVMTVETNDGVKQNVAYYVLMNQNMLYNPNSGDIRFKSRKDWKLIRTNDNCYKLYTQFLSSKRESLLKQAERIL
jgi:hypothetical protein